MNYQMDNLGGAPEPATERFGVEAKINALVIKFANTMQQKENHPIVTIEMLQGELNKPQKRILEQDSSGRKKL
jgi:low affinity Fe/Cu permease